MNFFFRTLPMVAVAIVFTPSIAQAGMPSITLTDLPRMRVQTISFFLVMLLLSSGLVQLLWNYLRRDFSSLPRLSYGKALSAVILWGLLFVLVLTMISGARELMTPGAWEKQGLTYRLSSSQSDISPPWTVGQEERRESLDRLRRALWEYARKHDGLFPSQVRISAAGIADDLWLSPGPFHPRYHYLGGLGVLADRGSFPLVYEPAAFGDRRLVLFTNGTIQEMDVEEILATLEPGER